MCSGTILKIYKAWHEMWYCSPNVNTMTKTTRLIISKAQLNWIAKHWSYCSLALSHRYKDMDCIQCDNKKVEFWTYKRHPITPIHKWTIGCLWWVYSENDDRDILEHQCSRSVGYNHQAINKTMLTVNWASSNKHRTWKYRSWMSTILFSRPFTNMVWL